MLPAAEPHRDPATGRWLCNAAAGCDRPAVAQWSAPHTEGGLDDTVPVFGCTEHQPDSDA
jgi:hypothetical protein